MPEVRHDIYGELAAEFWKKTEESHKEYVNELKREQVNPSGTLLEFIRNSEKEFGMEVKCLGGMSEKEFREYVDFLDGLWGK